MGCRRSPFLNNYVNHIGCGPCFNEALKNSVNVGVSSSENDMWSGPVALCSLSVHRSLWMPFCVIMMCCMSGCGLLALVRLSDLMNPSLSCSC